MTTNNDNSNGPKVVPLPAQPDQVAAAGENLRRNLDAMIATAETIAKLRRAAFLAYVKAGFTEQQALELCCK